VGEKREREKASAVRGNDFVFRSSAWAPFYLKIPGDRKTSHTMPTIIINIKHRPDIATKEIKES
jgi:hypothetical protein